MTELELISKALFENIRHINEYGQEYWIARELMPVLEYAQWRRFNETIERAQESCTSSGNDVSDHFADVGKMVDIGSGAWREVEDYHLSRYACYLVAMSGDPRKHAVALAQTYVAVKTRQQEIVENYGALTEDQKRLAIRHEMKEHNKALAAAAQEAGIISPQE